MNKYFNVKFLFDHNKFEKLVESTLINGKGYCCFVDLNSLVNTYRDKNFRAILNRSLANSCDGSYIALSASKIHNENLKEYIGPDFFKKFIYHKKKHLIIGNTEEVFIKIKNKVEIKNGVNDNLHYLPLPFKSVEEFDFEFISQYLNEISPDYIWVSLGAPKQEYFMYNLLPHINRGVMLGVGAALNYYSGEINDIPQWTKRFRIIWVYRLFTEPKKQFKRLRSIFLIFPKMILEEKRRVENIN